MDFGINPDVDEDALPKVQKMIDAIGKTGGIVYFPKGRYYFNRNRANRNFSSHKYFPYSYSRRS